MNYSKIPNKLYLIMRILYTNIRRWFDKFVLFIYSFNYTIINYLTKLKIKSMTHDLTNINLFNSVLKITFNSIFKITNTKMLSRIKKISHVLFNKFFSLLILSAIGFLYNIPYSMYNYMLNAMYAFTLYNYMLNAMYAFTLYNYMFNAMYAFTLYNYMFNAMHAFTLNRIGKVNFVLICLFFFLFIHTILSQCVVYVNNTLYYIIYKKNEIQF